jgi:hypothetical protein
LLEVVLVADNRLFLFGFVGFREEIFNCGLDRCALGVCSIPVLLNRQADVNGLRVQFQTFSFSLRLLNRIECLAPNELSSQVGGDGVTNVELCAGFDGWTPTCTFRNGFVTPSSTWFFSTDIDAGP